MPRQPGEGFSLKAEDMEHAVVIDNPEGVVGEQVRPETEPVLLAARGGDRRKRIRIRRDQLRTQRPGVFRLNRKKRSIDEQRGLLLRCRALSRFPLLVERGGDLSVGLLE